MNTGNRNHLNRRQFLMLLMGMGAFIPALQQKRPLLFEQQSLTSIPIPRGFPWTPPFKLYRNGGSIVVDPSFDLKTYAGITVNKTYWVATAADGGSERNSGADAAHPHLRVSSMMRLRDCDCVMVKAGVYDGETGWSGVSPARSMQVIGYGGPVIFQRTASGLGWTLVGNHYETSYTSTGISNIVDFSSPDAYGDGIPLYYEAGGWIVVDTVPGTWFNDTTTHKIYVHTLDNRQPDANIVVYTQLANGLQKQAVTCYVENIEFRCGSPEPFLLNISTPGAKFYGKNCAFKYSPNTTQNDGFLANGGSEVILQNCVAAWQSGDGFKAIKVRISANMALLNCIGRNNGGSLPPSPINNSSNGYSRHGDGSSIIVNSEFFGSRGPNCNSINDNTFDWYLGVYCHDPRTEDSTAFNFGIRNASKAWLDTCKSSGAALCDIEAEEGATALYHNMTPALPRIFGTNGTFTPY